MTRAMTMSRRLATLLLCLAAALACGADKSGAQPGKEQPGDGNPAAEEASLSPAMQEYLTKTYFLAEPDDAQRTRSLAATVLAGTDFGGAHDEPRWTWDWRFHGNPEKDDKPDNPWLKSLSAWLAALSSLFGTLGHVVLWLLLLVMLLLVWRKRDALLALLPTRRAPTEIIAGIDIAPLLTPDALPEDVIAAARHLWHRDHARDALGLLYRAALHHLGARLAFAIPASGTEQECLRLVQRHADAATAKAFRQLVNAWTRCAWADQQPAELDALLDDYRATVMPAAPDAEFAR